MESMKGIEKVEEAKSDDMKVSQEDYNVLQEYKKYKSERANIQVEYEQNRTIRYSKLVIAQAEREIAFKEKQLQEGIIVETLSRKDPDTGLTTGFIDSLKPTWYLKNEIEKLKFDIDEHKFRIKMTKRAKSEVNVFTK